MDLVEPNAFTACKLQLIVM